MLSKIYTHTHTHTPLFLFLQKIKLLHKPNSHVIRCWHDPWLVFINWWYLVNQTIHVIYKVTICVKSSLSSRQNSWSQTISFILHLPDQKFQEHTNNFTISTPALFLPGNDATPIFSLHGSLKFVSNDKTIKTRWLYLQIFYLKTL